MFEAAKKEQKISASDLLAEIKLILPDYFVSENVAADNSVILHFYNGQNFTLTIAEK